MTIKDWELNDRAQAEYIDRLNQNYGQLAEEFDAVFIGEQCANASPYYNPENGPKPDFALPPFHPDSPVWQAAIQRGLKRDMAKLKDDVPIMQNGCYVGVGKLPTDAAVRKATPVATGFVDYFPLAMACVAELSRVGNDQHNPGMPLFWDRSKSGDESDALMRHFLERGTLDSDGIRHSAKVAWRAMALLQKELEAESDGIPNSE